MSKKPSAKKPKAEKPALPREEGERAPRPDVRVVGIGASAGGVDALKLFFPEVKRDSGMAFVVVQHLDPDHRSVLSEILARVTELPVATIEDDMPVEADHVYVVPSNTSLTIANGRLYLARPVERRGMRTPIDVFLMSLAEDRGEHAACVILSGTGSDGTIGLRAIKGNGGVALAQEGAEYDGMMRSALSTGLVDFVLPAEAMPAKLADYFRQAPTIDETKGPDGKNRESAEAFGQLCALLRARTGHDFSGYKDKAILRRMQRRMQILQIDNVPDFLDRLRKDSREVDFLFQDLLIGVTNFFRDPAVFETLGREIVPRLFEGKGPHDTVRIWVAGCATGEEAYSIALLLREFMPKSHVTPKLQVFASDIDDHALAIARMGRYPATIAKDVPAKLLDRYFLHEDGTYRINTDIREICIFANHNILRDAPFSKLDLISCRNLLIYLGTGMQQRLIPLFHYALRDPGYLLLGSSENVTRHARLFSVVDKECRIFKRRPQSTRQLPEFPLMAPVPTVPRHGVPSQPPAEGSIRDLAERLLLERYAPAYVVINLGGDVHYASARTGKYLELPAGPPTSNIFSLARKGLRLDLRAAIHKAIESNQIVVHNNISIGANGGQQLINLIAQPMRNDSEDKLCLIVFQDLGPIKPQPERAGALTDGALIDQESEGATVRQLEAELLATRERLQTTLEELESSNEELRSSNEELSSMNEELQSANEELETSKEELQSINEELQTVNAELKGRVEELGRANSDIVNLLESTQIATVFLDRNLAIKSFTPAAKDVFRLVESDTGRPLAHVRSRLRLDTVQEDAERVLRTLGTYEEQVESEDGAKRFIMRILPYRTVDNVIAGVVISVIDITRVAAAEREISRLTRDLRDRVEALETLFELVPVGILVSSNDPNLAVQINRHGARLLGDEDERHGLRPVAVPYRLFDGQNEVPFWDQPLQKASISGGAVPATELRLVRRDGSSVDVIMQAEPLFDETGATRGAIAALVDISERKKAEAHLELLLNELRHRVKNILASVASLATRMLSSKPPVEEFAAAFDERLQALGRLQELLWQKKWAGVPMADVAMKVLAPYAGASIENIELTGPAVLLPPNTATTLGMALHELASNATKYGALSVPAGQVGLSWQLSEDGTKKKLSLLWKERNGPRIEAFPTMGFGTRFIVQSIDYELEGVARLNFQPDGLRCAIEFPLQDVPTP